MEIEVLLTLDRGCGKTEGRVEMNEQEFSLWITQSITGSVVTRKALFQARQEASLNISYPPSLGVSEVWATLNTWFFSYWLDFIYSRSKRLQWNISMQTISHWLLQSPKFTKEIFNLPRFSYFRPATPHSSSDGRLCPIIFEKYILPLDFKNSRERHERAVFTYRMHSTFSGFLRIIWNRTSLLYERKENGWK